MRTININARFYDSLVSRCQIPCSGLRCWVDRSMDKVNKQSTKWAEIAKVRLLHNALGLTENDID